MKALTIRSRTIIMPGHVYLMPNTEHPEVDLWTTLDDVEHLIVACHPDHEARCRIRRREERDIARADRATLLEAIATFEGALFAAGGASTVALFGTASKIRERTTE